MSPELEAVARSVADADSVHVRGAGTHRGIGGTVPDTATEVRAPEGVVRYEPADMTVTVRAGTTVAALDAALAERGQECPLDPRDDDATVGGVLACGLTGPRRLRTGPVRDRLLEVWFITGDAQLVRGGGPTVKNVTGYDLPRLLVGSHGTLGVIAQVTLRTQPRPVASTWARADGDPGPVRAALFRPSCVSWDGARTHVLLEGHPDDLAQQLTSAGLVAVDGAPPAPPGEHRARISVRPGSLDALTGRLRDLDCAWLAEAGVGTVHVGAATEAVLAAARRAAETEGGWLLREAGASGLDPFGAAWPNPELQARLRAAFDPPGKLNPGRVPTVRSAA